MKKEKTLRLRQVTHIPRATCRNPGSWSDLLKEYSLISDFVRYQRGIDRTQSFERKKPQPERPRPHPRSLNAFFLLKRKKYKAQIKSLVKA